MYGYIEFICPTKISFGVGMVLVPVDTYCTFTIVAVVVVFKLTCEKRDVENINY